MAKKPTDGEILEGFPKDGEVIEPDDPPVAEGEPGKKPAAATPPVDPMQILQDEMKSLRQEQAALRKENQELRTPKQKPQEEPEIDFEKAIFDDPKGTLEAYGRKIRKEITEDLRTQYTRDQNERAFWDSFYKKHSDLGEDRDLVQATLNGNMDALADMRAEDAGDKLADLTRERIMRYTGGKPAPGKKTVVEGAQRPAERPKPPEENTVRSLTDILRQRRESRRASGKAITA